MKKVWRLVKVILFAAAMPILLFTLFQSSLDDAPTWQGGGSLPPLATWAHHPTTPSPSSPFPPTPSPPPSAYSPRPINHTMLLCPVTATPYGLPGLPGMA